MAATATTALDTLLAVSAMLTEDTERFAAAEGVTPARLHLLWELQQAGPAQQRRLAERLGVTARNITGLVDALAMSGHVVREPDPTDRRAVLVTLTGTGGELAQRLTTMHAQLADQLFGDLPGHRLQSVTVALQDVLGRMAALLATADASGHTAGDAS